MKDVLKLQQLTENSETKKEEVWFTITTISVTLSTISNHC
ncbi:MULTISPECIES: class III lanthipeptide [Bacillus]